MSPHEINELKGGLQLAQLAAVNRPEKCGPVVTDPSGKRKSALLLRTILLSALLAPATARAAVFTVTSANNNGGGTLRQAIANANGSAGAATIVFHILPPRTSP